MVAKTTAKKLLHAGAALKYAKKAVTVGCSPVVLGECPRCQEMSLFRSLRPGDLITNKVLSYFTGSSMGKTQIGTYYCMNPNCKKGGYYWGYCYRAPIGILELTGSLPFLIRPIKRIFNID